MRDQIELCGRRALALPSARHHLPAPAGETPKNGGIADLCDPGGRPAELRRAPRGTFATVHSAAPFYSVLIRVDPNNPSSTTDFVCDLCTAMPQPTDGGRTYTFKIRDGVKFHDGVAVDRRRCGGELEQASSIRRKAC